MTLSFTAAGGPYQVGAPEPATRPYAFLGRDITIEHSCESTSVIYRARHGTIDENLENYRITTVGTCWCKFDCAYSAAPRDFKVREPRDIIYFDLVKSQNGSILKTQDATLRFWVGGQYYDALPFPSYRVLDLDNWPTWLWPVTPRGNASLDGLDAGTALLRSSGSSWTWDVAVALTASSHNMAEGTYTHDVVVQPQVAVETGPPLRLR